MRKKRNRIKPNKFVHHVPHASTSTGIVGVHLILRVRRKRTKLGISTYRVLYVLALHPNGKHRREFSCERHGLSRALRMGRKVRAEFVRDHLEG